MISDGESIKKMLRAVLQSSKEGVSVSRLQAEFRSLCGDSIPFKALGFSRLEDYLRSIPSVVRLDCRMGELRCFAAVCKETAHIAELVAKQKSSKKSSQSQLVNCKMRFKRSDPYMLNAASRLSLRQPSAAPYWTTRRIPQQGGYQSVSGGGSSAGVGNLMTRHPARQQSPRLNHVDQRGPAATSRSLKGSTDQRTVAEITPMPASSPKLAEPGVYSVQQLQTRLGQLLQKYRFGLWMSKLPQLYKEMFTQQLHPQAMEELDTWTHVCMVEKPSGSRADRLIYPPLPSSTPSAPSAPFVATVAPPPTTAATARPPHLPVAPQSSLAKPKPSSPWQPVAAPPGGQASEKTAASLDHRGRRHPLAVHAAPSQAPPLQPHQDVPPPLKASPASSSPAPSSPAPSSPTLSSPVPSALGEDQETRLKVKDLLVKYSHGLWAPALPKLFSDTFKMPFPQHLLDDPALFMDFCRVEYPIPNDKQKAILYYSSSSEGGGGAGGAGGADPAASDDQTEGRGQGLSLPSGVALVSPVTPPPLVAPPDQYPSVLVTETQGSRAVTIRYVGKNYSSAQETMEENMLCFYSQGSTHLLSSPVFGQLVAIRAEQGSELARAQVVELLYPQGVKVYYVDYGFSAVTSVASLLELHQDFLSLPFQATNVQLAGLETFSSSPGLQASLDKLATGKILLMEVLEVLQPSGPPAVVLYDTSQEEDVNVNAACLTALQDKTMNSLLTVNVTYEGVRVTSVSSEGAIYCQLPSRGASRLHKCLEDTEAIFSAQVTSESLLSRPFTGQLCLAQHQGKWSRVQISNTFGSRVIEILHIDLGIQATVEVTDLREIPPSVIQELVVIPPQATKCRLAELPVPEGDWIPEAVQMVKEELLASEDCKMKIVKLEQYKDECLVHVYLFIGADGQDPDQSINRRLAQSHLWNQRSNSESSTVADTSSSDAQGAGDDLVTDQDQVALSNLAMTLTQPLDRAERRGCSLGPEVRRLPLPPPLEVPRAGQNLDVFIPVACHPGHFVLQQWGELHKLMVLMGEMMLYYNRNWKVNRAPLVDKGEVYAAKIDKNWRRVQAKVILANGFVSVYELDHGHHELVHCSHFQPLIEEFRQLPFQAVGAQLAGVSPRQWSEEASMLFRNHVEDRALVAKVESVQECSEIQGEPWERRWTVFLVDTSQEDQDLWVHSMMANIDGELSSAA